MPRRGHASTGILDELDALRRKVRDLERWRPEALVVYGTRSDAAGADVVDGVGPRVRFGLLADGVSYGVEKWAQGGTATKVNQVLTKAGAPVNGVDGSGDDVLIDTTTGDLWDQNDDDWGAAPVGNLIATPVQWYTTHGVPDDATGNDNDLDLNLDTGDVLQKAAGTWAGAPIGNIRGPSGQSGVTGWQWYVGSGAPATDLGAAGDRYIDDATTPPIIYRKTVTFTTITAATAFSETGSVAAGSATSAGTLTPVANRGYLVVVATNGGLGASGVSLSGCGFTWVLERQVQVQDRWVTIFRGMKPSGLSAGQLTLSGAGAATSYQMHVVELNGVDTTGSDGDGMTVQTAAAAFSTSTTSVSCTLNPFADAAHNATFYAALHLAAEGTSPESGFTELADTNAGGMGLETAWRLGADTTPTATWTTASRRGIVAVEIAAGQTSPQWLPMDLAPKPRYVGYVAEGSSSAATAMAAANDAIAIPVEIPTTWTSVTVRLNIGVSSGSLDVGLLAEDGTRLRSLGSTASPGTGIRSFTWTSVSGLPGRYWLIVSADNTSLRFNGVLSSLIIAQARKITSCHPIPSTVTLGSTAPAFVPQITMELS